MEQVRQTLGRVALAMGLQKTAAHLKAKDPLEFSTPAGLQTLDPAQPGYALTALELLVRHPFDPRILSRLVTDGYFDACPATATVLAMGIFDRMIWPPEYRGLLQDVLYAHANEGILLSDVEDLPTKWRLLGNLGHLYDAVYQYDLPGDFDRGDTPIAVARAAKAALVRNRTGAKAPSVSEIEEKLAQAALDLPDWESWATLRAIRGRERLEYEDQLSDGAHRQAWELRNAGADTSAYYLVNLLAHHLPNNEVYWLAVEIALDNQLTQQAENLAERMTEPEKNDDASLDALICARARVALAKGDLKSMKLALGPWLKRFLEAPLETTVRFPRASTMAMEYQLRSDEPDPAYLTCTVVAISECPGWLYPVRLNITMSAAMHLERDQLDGVFRVFDEAVKATPARVGLWEPMFKIAEQDDVARAAFEDRLIAHVIAHPFSFGHWFYLSEVSSDKGLRRALAKDLKRYGKNLPPRRRRTHAALARRAAQLGLEKTRALLVSYPQAHESLERPLTPTLSTWFRSLGVDPPDVSVIFTGLQQAPLHTKLLGRLTQMGFFQGMPLVSAFAARQILRDRFWEGPVPEAITQAAALANDVVRAGAGSLDSLRAAIECLGDAPPPQSARWCNAINAKREYFFGNKRAALRPLTEAVQTYGDTEAALILAAESELRPPFTPINLFTYALRLGGFVQAAATVGALLLPVTQDPKGLFFVVDPLLESGEIAAAETLVDRTLDANPLEQLPDLPLSAVMRVWLSRGKADAVRQELSAVESGLATDFKNTISTWPVATFVLADTMLRQGETPDSEMIEALRAAQNLVPQLPFGRAVRAAALLRYGLSRDSLPLAFAGLIGAISAMPGEVGVFRRLFDSGLPDDQRFVRRYFTLLEWQVATHPHLRGLWTVLAEQTEDKLLAKALGLDLQG